MNIGIRLHDTLPGSLAERLAFAKAQGFSCAHVALSKVLDDFAMNEAPEKLTEEYAVRVREDFDASGLECAVLGCYLNLADPDTERRARTQEIYKAHLRFAPKIGARVVGTETFANPASGFADPASSEEAFQLFMDSLRPVVRCAEEVGALLAVEPVYYHIISTPERAARMLEELPSDSLRIILDAPHAGGASFRFPAHHPRRSEPHRAGECGKNRVHHSAGDLPPGRPGGDPPYEGFRPHFGRQNGRLRLRPGIHEI